MFYFLYGKWALRGNDYSDVKIQELKKKCLSYLVPYCDVRYDFWVKTMFGSTFLPSALSEVL
jgi:hypothetical protein